MKGRKAILIITIILISFFIPSRRYFAHIPEPDNIFYGMVVVNGELLTAESQATINLKIDPNSEPIASYIMGSNSNAGDFYILRVPIFAHASDNPHIAHTGDEVNIYINDELAGIVNIGERGNIQLYHLDINIVVTDSDGDGLSDSLEIALGTDSNNPDTDGDGLSDGEEANTYMTDPLLSDTDGDGLSDGYEVENNMDPLAPDEGTNFAMNLFSGWSMISLPIKPGNASLSSLFPNARVVYGYEKGIGYTRVISAEELQTGEGYWILLDQNQTYNLAGQAIESYKLPVSEDGWAMIGGCTSDARPTTDNCSIGVIYRYVKGAGYQRVLGTENLEPGIGCWILFDDVVDQCELIVEVIDPNI
jgi:hypothetical protein